MRMTLIVSSVSMSRLSKVSMLSMCPFCLWFPRRVGQSDNRRTARGQALFQSIPPVI